MSDIQRYTNLINGDEVVRNDNGHLVKYKDHLKAMEYDNRFKDLLDQLKTRDLVIQSQSKAIEGKDKEIETAVMRSQGQALAIRELKAENERLEQKWISVDDRLPDSEYYVWAYHPEVGVTDELFCDKLDFIDIRVGHTTYRATHWMDYIMPQRPTPPD